MPCPRIVVVPPSHRRNRRDRQEDGAGGLRPDDGRAQRPRRDRGRRRPRPNTSSAIPNVPSNDAFYHSGAEAQALPAAQRRLRRRRPRGRAPRQGAGLQQRRRQRHLGVRARHDADARRCRAAWSGSTTTSRPAAGAATAPAPRMYEVYDKTLGIVGLGTIGKKVARLARALRHAGAVLRHRAAAGARGGRARRALPAVARAARARSDIVSACTCRSTPRPAT